MPNPLSVDEDGFTPRRVGKLPELAMPYGRELDELIERSRSLKMTPEQAEAQRQSFVYGNCAIDNPLVTREMVEEASKKEGQ